MHYDSYVQIRKDLKDQGYAVQMGDTLFGFEMCLESDAYPPGEIAVAYKSRFVDRFLLSDVSIREETPEPAPVEEKPEDYIPPERILEDD